MKTLDEVIKAYELSCGKKDCSQCPYDDECLDHFVCECYERMDDTFHYLKEYRMMMDDIVAKRKKLEAEIDRYQEAVRNCEEAENKYRKAEQEALKALDDWASRPVEENKKLVLTADNPPLTWDELTQMESKTVWVVRICRGNDEVTDENAR